MNGCVKNVLWYVTDDGWIFTYKVETKKSAFSVKNNLPS